MSQNSISSDPSELNRVTSCKVSVLYENRAAGIRAGALAKQMAQMASNGAEGEIGLWRCELLDLPGMLELVSSEVEGAECFILSLKGDAPISVATKHVIESWLVRAADRPSVLIALFDPEKEEGRHAGGICSYLDHVAGAAGIPFMSRRTLPVPVPMEDAPKSLRRSEARGRRNRSFSETLAA